MICGCVGCQELFRIWGKNLTPDQRDKYETIENFREEQIRLHTSVDGLGSSVECVGPSPTQQTWLEQQHEKAFERWLKYERAILENNPNLSPLSLENLPDTRHDLQTIVFPKETVMRFRANYKLLVNALGELLELDPEKYAALDLAAKVKETMYLAKRNSDGTDH